jgi:predicted transcriptional regulator
MATMDAHSKILVVNPSSDRQVLRGLASELRLRILEHLARGPRNVNQLAQDLGLPQSTVATNVAVLEECGLVRSEIAKARKGSQKICSLTYEEVVVRFDGARAEPNSDVIEVEMPIGLFTSFEASAPCGLCSTESIIGYLDVPASFLDPGRMKTGLLWFEKGWVEYKFPNNGLYKERPVQKVELSAELSSETPGTNRNWLSDVTVWINGVEIGSWTSPGDFGDRRGKLTPEWWKLEGSQYGLLKHWSVTPDGSFVDGVRISDVRLKDLALPDHHSIRVRIGVKAEAEHVGGMNLFGRGFGNYDQAIVLRLSFV